MVQPIGPIRGTITTSPEATAEEVHGSPANPYHEYVGEQAQPYPWQAYGGAWGAPTGPLGAENELLGDEPSTWTFAAGMMSQDPTGDETPYHTHAAPHIDGSNTTADPAGEARRLQQSYAAHSVNTNAGASRLYDPTAEASQDQWEGFYNVVPGDDMTPQAPTQIGFQANGFGSKDHTSNPLAARNQYGYDSSHRHRRYATGSIPGNYMWMIPGQRPMVKSLASAAQQSPIGPGPFQGQDTTQSFNIDGAILQNPATEYQTPPQPYIAPPIAQQNNAPAIALW